MSALKLCNISKTFSGGTQALKDVSIEIKEGSFTTILGPSGSGKSTLLRIIAGLEVPTSGKIFLDEADITALPPAKRKISMVFQGFALYPHMTVYENMAFALKTEGVSKAEIERRITDTAEYLEIAEILKRKPETLSGGQKQRVAIGRAIVRRPNLFLFDEALSNLDEKLKEAMRELLMKIHRTLGTTMIYVTHDQKEALSLSDFVVLLEDGALQQAASPIEIYKRPVNLFAASFIGSPTMNFLSLGDFERVFGYEVSLDANGSPDANKPSDEQYSLGGVLDTELSAVLCTDQGADNIILGIRPEHFEVLGDIEDCSETYGAEVESAGDKRACDAEVGATGCKRACDAGAEFSGGKRACRAEADEIGQNCYSGAEIASSEENCVSEAEFDTIEDNRYFGPEAGDNKKNALSYTEFTIKSVSYMGANVVLKVERERVSLDVSLQMDNVPSLGGSICLKPILENVLVFDKKQCSL